MQGVAFGTLANSFYSYGEVITIPPIYIPIFFVISHLLWLIPTFINPKYFDRSLPYWKVNGAFIMVFFALFDVLFVFLGWSINLIFATVVFTILFTHVYFRMIIIFKTEEDLKVREEVIKFLGAFPRPQKPTEEEVSISKEKKACLVCKKRLSKQIYLCSKCGAFYCVNFLNSL